MGPRHHAGMHTEDPTLAPWATPAGPLDARAWLNLWASLGVLAWGLPARWGGPGPGLAALQRCAQACWVDNPAAAAVLRAQRLAIEALCRGRNVGLCEHLLPQLLSGERAASLPGALDATALSGTDTGRGWRLQGLLPAAANLQPEGFSFIAPVQLAGEPLCWVVLRGEEDGLDVLPPHLARPLPWARAAALGDVRCRGFFFREDEWLADAALTAPLLALDQLLSPPPGL